MAQNLNLVLRISGDASGLTAEIVGAKRDVEGLGTTGAVAGQQAAGGLQAMAAAAARVVGALATVGGAAAGIMAVARAGDTANAALGRLAVATGSAETAVDVYGRLYELSQRTGVSVAEAAGAFQRFAIAAREAGTTQAQILSIVQVMQQAGALAGATAQETANATMQLGQALASGRLQGDELRSFMENMPNLAEALARELGVGVGELRKLGEEGKLTADVVIPAMQRAAARMNEEFQKLPPSLERSMGVLRQASSAFLADLDRAAGLSTFLARALGREGVAGSLDTARRELGLGNAVESAEVEVQRRRSALIQARRNAGGADEFGLGEGAVERAEAELRAAEERLAALRAGARDRESEANAANEARGAENRRRTSEAEIAALRETLDRRLAIRREAQERENTITRALAAGALTAEDAARDRAASAAREREQLAALNRSTADGGMRDVDQTLQDLRRTRDEGARLAESLRTPLEVLNDQTAEYNALLARGAISQETFNRALARAQAQYQLSLPANVAQREAAAMQRTFDELGRMGERAFDRVGSSITQALAQGQLDFRRLNQVGLAVASELTQAFLQLAIINPIRNAVVGGNATTFSDVSGAIGRWWNGAPSTANVDASLSNSFVPDGAGGFVRPLHSGGIAGLEGQAPRYMPASIFATAPRFHAGRIAPDEVPAILRRDEGVFTPAQMARLGPAGGSYTFAPTIHWQGGSSQDPEAFAAMLRQMWQADMQRMAPGIVEASKASLRMDVRRMGADRALAGAA
jgi:tape measure domain-containing protein